MAMAQGLFRPGRWRLPITGAITKPITSLIPDGAASLDRQQTDFFRRSIRQLMRQGDWEQAWALIELTSQTHRYSPVFIRACVKARRHLRRRLFAPPHPGHPSLQALRQPFGQLSGSPEHAVIELDPQTITHWGCVVFPGMALGRFEGPRQCRFCNAVVEERYLFRGLALADDPLVRILRRRFEQGMSWEQCGGRALFAERRQRRRDSVTTWARFRDHQLRNWDGLFERIQAAGYRSQADLQAMGCAPEHYGLFNEVEVCVTAAAQPLFLEGRHRLVIAQILNLPAIPVIVNVWSEGFIRTLPAPFSPALAQQQLQVRSQAGANSADCSA
jgi:hypothetical protein